MQHRTGWIIVGIVAGLAWALASSTNLAQSPSPVPANGSIGVVDLVRVFNEFEQTRALNAELDRLRMRLSDEQQQREEKLTIEQQTLQGFSPDSAEYHQRRQAFQRMMIEYQTWLAVERDGLKDEHFRWIERTYSAVIRGIDEVAQRKGIQVVFTREELDTSVEDATVLQQQILNRKVVYFDKTLDLTDDVLTVINERFASSGGASAIRIRP